MNKSVVVAAGVGITAVVAFAIVFVWRRNRRAANVQGPVEVKQGDNVVDIEFEKFRKTLSPQDVVIFDDTYGELNDLAMRHLNEDNQHELGTLIVSCIYLRNMLNAAKVKNNDDDVRKYSRSIIEGTSTVLEGALREFTEHLNLDLQERIKVLSDITMNYIIAGVAREQFLNHPPERMVQ